MEADKFGFLGFSMGGRTGFEIAASNPDRLSLLAIGGMDLRPPAAEKDRFERNMRVLRSGRTKSIENPDGDRPSNDPLALAASHEALLQWSGANKRLSNHTAPTLLFCGEKDQHFDNAKYTAKSMKFQFTALPDTDHYSTFFSSPQAVSSVTRFVSKQLT
jgi:pimeloyl-ACP methyl ester carboxylesterase